MKLFELTVIGDENAIGRLLSDATINLKHLKRTSKHKKVINALISTLDGLSTNPNILSVDSYSLVTYLQKLVSPNISLNDLNMVADALSSFDDSDGD